MTTIERFFEYLEFKGVKHTPIEKKLGLSNGYLGKMLKKKGSLGDEILQKIFSFFPKLNMIWLLTGNGEMEMSERVASNIKNLRVQCEGAVEGAVNKFEGAVNKFEGANENLGFDMDSKCSNCQIIIKKYFEARDLIWARDKIIATKEEKIDGLNRQIGRLEGENERLHDEIAYYVAAQPKTGTHP